MKEIIHKKYCVTCKTTDEDQLHKNAKKEHKDHINQYYQCKSCTSAKLKKYYSALTPEQKQKWSKRANKWNEARYKKNQEKD